MPPQPSLWKASQRKDAKSQRSTIGSETRRLEGTLRLRAIGAAV